MIFWISFEEKVWMGEKSERKESVYSKYGKQWFVNGKYERNLMDNGWIKYKELYEECTCKTIFPLNNQIIFYG